MHPFMGIQNWDRVGLSVEECARRLQRIAYADRRTMRIAAGHMTARPEYEVKGALGRFAWQDAAHCDELRSRCKQLRMGSVAFERCPDPAWETLLDRALDSPSTLALLTALCEVIKPALIEAIHDYLALTQPLVDEPTVRMLRLQLIDREEQCRWGREALAEYRAAATEEERAAADRWGAYMRALLEAAGGADGLGDRREVPAGLVVPAEPFRLPEMSTRDSRFTPAVLKFEGLRFADSDEDRFRMMMYARFFEMTAAEAIARVHFAKEGMPWAFYYDTARHIWDEVRHAWFGEAALRLHGVDVCAAPNWTGWYEMTSQLFDLDEAYTHLTIAIEKAAMKYPPGKREEWEFCRDVARHPLMTTFQDFDWADEVVHAGFGQRWIVDRLHGGDAVKAKEAGDRTMRMREAFMARHGAGKAEAGASFAGEY